jgi:long-chain acyl-CoA synthetase
MRKAWMVAAFGVVVAASAQAAEVGGVKLDDKVSVGGQELVLNGAGVRSRVFIKIYVGSIYLPAKANALAAVLEKGPRRIQMNLLRDLSPDQLVGALSDGIKDNTSSDEQVAIKPQLDQMIAVMKGFGEVKEKDVVTLDFVEGGTRIGLNGAAKGTIPGDAFNRALTRIWLGENPAQADLKKAMLGG